MATFAKPNLLLQSRLYFLLSENKASLTPPGDIHNNCPSFNTSVHLSTEPGVTQNTSINVFHPERKHIKIISSFLDFYSNEKTQ